MKASILLVRNVLSLLLFLAFSFTVNAQTAPTVTTDEPDYPPGATVIITGTGFLPGESVKVQVTHIDEDPSTVTEDEHQPWYVTADGDGNFTTTWYVPIGGDEIGATLIVNADGQTSGLHAETFFTDANIVIIANTLWSAITTGSGSGGAPNASDAIVVKNGATLTVDVPNGVCGSLQLGVSGGADNGNGTLVFNAGSQVTISAASLSGALTLGNTPRTGSMNFSLGGMLKIAGAVTISSIGTITPGTGTIDYIGTAAQTIPIGNIGLVYNNLHANNTSVAGATLAAAITATNVVGNIRVQSGLLNNGGFAITMAASKTFEVANGATFRLTGTSGMATGASLTKTFGATSTVDYAGTNQTISAESYGHLTTSGSATKTLAGAVTVNGNLTIGAGTTLDPSASNFGINLFGNWVNNGSFTPQSATVTLTGSAAQNISGGVTTFGTTGAGGLTINKAAAGVTLGADVTVNGALTLTNGIIDGTTNNKTVTIGAAGSASAGSNSSHVSGKLARVFNAPGDVGVSKNFPVGKGGAWKPVSFTYTSLTGNSTVVAEQFENGFPGTAPAGTGQVGTRYWNVTETGGTGIVYNITLDGTGLSFSGSPRILKHSSGTTVAIVPVSPNYTASGLNSLSDFALGEVTIIPTTTTADNANATYGDASVTLSATVSPNPAGGTVEFFVNNVSVGSGAVNGSGVATFNYNPSALNAGGYTIKANFSGFNAYEASTSDPSTNGTLTIGQRPLTVTATAGQTKVYGDADPLPFAYTITSGTLASGDAFDGALARAAGENVGSYAINQGTLTILKGAVNVIANYNFSFVSNDFTITQRPLTVTATAGQTKVYGDTDPLPFAYSITSGTLASGDAFDGALARAAGENVGSYAINQGTLTILKGAVNVISNYNFSFVSNDFTITQRPLTVTATTGQTKVYGNADPLPFTYSITSGTLAPGDAFDGALARAAGENVGSYAINQGTLTILKGAVNVIANYNFSFVSNDFTITQRPLTVTATAGQTKVYGNADPLPFTYSITSGTLAPGDAFDGALARAAGENVGSYAINQGTLTILKGAVNVIANYNFSFVSNDFTITQRPLTVTATAGQTKVYGNADPLPFAYSITSGTLAPGDAFDGALARAAGENVGSYAINQGTLTILKGAVNVIANYNFSFVSNDFTITQRPLTVTATAGQTKVYGNADPLPFTYSITSGTLAPGDAFEGALARAAGENVGSYVINQGTLTILKGAVNVIANYNFSFVSNDFTITQRPLTVTATAGQTKVYGNADPLPFAYSITSGTLAPGDAFDGALARAAGENVGSYAINQGTLTIKKGIVDVLSNYNFSFVSNDFTITQRPLTVTATAGQTKVYGNADPLPFAYSITSGTLAPGDAFDGALARAAGENVGSYAINQGTLTILKGAVNVIANYNFSFVSNDFTITQRPLTVTATAGQTKVYGNADPLPFTYSITSGTLAPGDAFDGALARAAGENVGSYAINQGTLTIKKGIVDVLSNYNFSFVSNDFTITQRPLTVTATAGQTKVYGNADPLPFTYSITSGTLAPGDAFDGALARSAGENVGSYAINQGTLTILKGAVNVIANYNFSFVSNDFTITQRPLTVTATAGQTKVYGNADPLPFAYGITSGTLAPGDAFDGALARAAGENVGSYAINQGTLTILKGAVNVIANYNFSFVSNDFTITQRPLTVTATAGQTKVYGNADPLPFTYSITSGTLAPGDAFDGALARAAGENVGNYAINQGTLAILKGAVNVIANYNFSFVSNDFTITQRPLTVTATAGQTKVYGNADPLPFTYSITSGTLAPGDAFDGALARAAGENVGSYAINQGTLTILKGAVNVIANYNFSFVSNDFTITQRPLTVTATAGQTKVYGNADPLPFAYSITSGTLAPGDAFDGALARAAGENVGSYAINQGTLTIKKGIVDVLSNYNFSFVSNDFTITQRPLTVIATAGQTKVYGNADPLPFTYSITSGTLAPGDAFDGALARAAGENVGSYAINQGTLTILKGAVNVIANYNFSFVSNDFTITQRPLTVTATAGQTKVYGNADPLPFTYSITSGTLAPGDAFDGALARAAGENVGSYAISQGTLTILKGAVNVIANYNFSFVSNDFTITQRPLTVTATAGQTKVYGNADPLPFAYSITSGTLAPGDAFDGALARAAGENVGSYAINQGTLTIKKGIVDVLSNYNFSFVSNDFTITQRPLTVTATAGQTKVYGNADPLPFTYSITSGTLAPGDAFDGALARAAGENVGSYAINQGTLTIKKGIVDVLSNYNFSFVSNDFTITQRPLTVTATAGQTKVYGNADPLPFTYSITSGTLAPGDAFDGALARAAGENVGSYAINQGTLTIKKGIVDVLSNYNFSFVSNDFTITQRPLTVTATAGQTKVYGNADPLPFTYSITSGTLAPGDAFDGALTRVAGEDVGSYAINQGTLTIKKGIVDVLSNYNFTFVSNNFTITVATLYVKANNASKNYSDAMPTFTVTYTGFQNGDDPSDLGGTLVFTTTAKTWSAPGTYPITPSGLTSSNYNIIFQNGTLTVNKENAIADYTGAEFASTGCTNCTVGNLRLSVTLNDEPDGYPGDIRNAKVRFRIVPLNCNNLSEETAVYTSWRNVALININDSTIGTAFLDTAFSIGSCNAKTYNIYVEVNNYYTNPAVNDLVASVIVTKTLNDYVTGGGHLNFGSGANNKSSGTYKSSDNSKTNFGLNVKYSKTGNNLQGNVNLIVRSGGNTYQAKGIVGGSNGSLSVNVANPAAKKAVLTCKANFTDAATGLPVPFGSNATLQLQMTDKGEPGANNDTYAITLWGSNNTLLYSSSWTGSVTIEVPINGGNIQVNSSVQNIGNLTTQARPNSVAVEAELPVITGVFEARVAPNPSRSTFILQIESGSTERIQLTVRDMLGRVVETMSNVNRGQTIKLGANYRPGTYVAEVVQGQKRKTITLIKQSD